MTKPKHRPGGGGGRGRSGRPGGKDDPQGELIRRMEACDTAEALNDRVIMPFVTALETVCEARGYVMNIYGEKANLVFTGDADAAEEIYALVEDYLDARAAAEREDDD